jgi:cysteinyl-tRNA synthetase
MKLHNTLTKQTEEFKPISDDQVKLYTCGPTVYSYYHIGNLRNAVFNDTLRRTLEASGYKLKHVMNITDVGHLVSDEDEGEDKLEKGAAKENKTVWEVAEFYTKAFERDVALLNILPPNGYSGPHGVYARATDFIQEQIDLVQLLIDKGFAYQTKQAIYFDVSKLDDYGKLSGQKLSDKEVGVRSDVVTDSDKKNPQDFAVWFFTVGRFAHHSMKWPSPWGEGFPGWHLECSAIIHSTLGEPIDIHTGAVDLIGTHHTNEIAQTEAALNAELANYWIHNEYILVDGQKMSKSKGNFFTLKDIIDKGYDPLALRMLYLQAHYRSQTNFTWESLEAAAAFLKRLQAWSDLRHQPNNKIATELAKPDITSYEEAFRTMMAEDLNTAQAIAELSSLESDLPNSRRNDEDLEYFNQLLQTIDNFLGLELSNRPDISSEDKSIIAEREEARESKDWARADQLRRKLLENGVEINDTAHGPIWSRL